MFHGLLFALVPVGLIWMLIVFPALRIALVIFVLAGCAIGYAIIQNENKNAAVRAEKADADAVAKEKASEDRRQREAARWSLVKSDQIQIKETALKQNSDTTFDGIVSAFNGSTMRVTAVEVVVTLYDCRSSSNDNQTKKTGVKPECDIIGEAKRVFEGSIPPSQVRALKSKLEFTNLPQAKGNATYKFVVTQVRASTNLKSTEGDDLIEKYLKVE